MLTVSFNAMHTPVQKPPTDMVPDPPNAASTCSNAAPPRNVINMMIEAADVQIGRVLADLGIGDPRRQRHRIDSGLADLGNTMVVIIGDNGSQGTMVRPGTEGPTLGGKFNPLRAKTTVYQTGVWVPLIVAGAPVGAPGRSVDHIVNVVDLFQLFGDLAGVKVEKLVPPSHTLDSQPMLPYLTTPGTAERASAKPISPRRASRPTAPIRRSAAGPACSAILRQAARSATTRCSTAKTSAKTIMAGPGTGRSGADPIEVLLRRAGRLPAMPPIRWRRSTSSPCAITSSS